MASIWVNLKGRVAWTKVYEPDRYSGSERWILNLYPFDDKEWDKFHKSGLQLETKEDIEGKFIRLRRPTSKIFKKEFIEFTPPEITGAVNVNYVNEANGEKVRSYRSSDNITVKEVGEKVLIGNGSVCVANICVYDTEKGKGHRLEGLKVLDLVVYDPDSVVTSGVKTEPIPVVESIEEKPAKTKKTTSKIEDMNDEIPW